MVDKIQKYDENNNPYRIGLDDRLDLVLSPGSALGRIHIKEIIQNDIFGYDKIEETKIGPHVQCPCTWFRIRKYGTEFNIPCKQVGDDHHDGIHQQVQSIEILLIILDHILLPSCKHFTILLQKVQPKVICPITTGRC